LGFGLFALGFTEVEIPQALAAFFGATTVVGMVVIVPGIAALAGCKIRHGWVITWMGASIPLVVAAHFHSMRALGLVVTGLLMVLAVWLVVGVKRWFLAPQTTSERLLGLAFSAYFVITALRLAATIHHTGPYEAHLLHVAPVFQGPVLIVCAGLPVLVAALVFNLLNERLRAALQHQATTDLLTGVLNRRAVVAQLPSLRASAAAERQDLAVVLMDLDHFKRVNDLHGHLVGDQVLVRAAQAAQRAVAAPGVVARWGGEEFVVMAPVASVAQARQLAERLRWSVAEAGWADLLGAEGRITTSVGLALLHPSEAVERAMDRADEALYRAKRDGRDRVTAALASA
jgi:diguanylate cyclase (GGDEF)-like protein